jgi:hypothetical protein
MNCGCIKYGQKFSVWVGYEHSSCASTVVYVDMCSHIFLSLGSIGVEKNYENQSSTRGYIVTRACRPSQGRLKRTQVLWFIWKDEFS